MRRIIALTTVVLFLGSGAALAVSAKKSIEYTGSAMGTVTFDGAVHKESVDSCKGCHNEGLFPKMKLGAVKITMDDIYAGKLCGVCHNGQKAFEAKGNCERCHIKK